MSTEREPEHEEAIKKVADFAHYYTTIAKRHRRTLVQTRYGERSGDPEIREVYESHENIMNGLLDMLLEHQDNFDPEATAKDKQEAVQLNGTAKVLIQLSHEPIPEYHDEWIIVLPDGNDYGNKW